MNSSARPTTTRTPSFVSASSPRKSARYLRGAVAPSFLKVAFADVGGVLTASFTDEHFTQPNAYFLGIKTKLDPTALARYVEDGDKFKLMPQSLATRAIRGIELKEERHRRWNCLRVRPALFPPGPRQQRADVAADSGGKNRRHPLDGQRTGLVGRQIYPLYDRARCHRQAMTLLELTEPLFQYICRLNRVARKAGAGSHRRHAFLTKAAPLDVAPARGASLDYAVVRAEIKAALGGHAAEGRHGYAPRRQAKKSSCRLFSSSIR